MSESESERVGTQEEQGARAGASAASLPAQSSPASPPAGRRRGALVTGIACALVAAVAAVAGYAGSAWLRGAAPPTGPAAAASETPGQLDESIAQAVEGGDVDAGAAPAAAGASGASSTAHQDDVIDRLRSVVSPDLKLSGRLTDGLLTIPGGGYVAVKWLDMTHPAPLGGATMTAEQRAKYTAFCDLTGDGIEDVVAQFQRWGGGAARWSDIAGVYSADQSGELTRAGSLAPEDITDLTRVGYSSDIEQIACSGGQARVTVLVDEIAESNAGSVPTARYTLVYDIVDGSLHRVRVDRSAL